MTLHFFWYLLKKDPKILLKYEKVWLKHFFMGLKQKISRQPNIKTPSSKTFTL
jgi:hypothetical protein